MGHQRPAPRASALTRPGVRADPRGRRSAEQRALGGSFGCGSGSRRMRKAFSEAEQAGEDRDEQRDLQGDRPGLGVDADDLVLHVRRLTGQELGELRCCDMSCGVVLQRGARPAAAGRRSAPCSTSAQDGEVIDERGEHDRAGEGEAEREPERAGRRVDAGGLADALVRDRARACSCSAARRAAPARSRR